MWCDMIGNDVSLWYSHDSALLLRPQSYLGTENTRRIRPWQVRISPFSQWYRFAGAGPFQSGWAIHKLRQTLSQDTVHQCYLWTAGWDSGGGARSSLEYILENVWWPQIFQIGFCNSRESQTSTRWEKKWCSPEGKRIRLQCETYAGFSAGSLLQCLTLASWDGLGTEVPHLFFEASRCGC